MNRDLKRVIADALGSMPASKVPEFVIEHHRDLFDMWARGAFASVVNRAVLRRQRAELRANPAQAWLPLPDLKDFQHIPVVVRKDSLEEFRERIAAKEREINSYKRARLSLQKERIAKRELREMKRLEPLISPYFVKDETMTVERAIALYQASLQTPAAKHSRKIASHAIKTRWHGPTKNQ